MMLTRIVCAGLICGLPIFFAACGGHKEKVIVYTENWPPSNYIYRDSALGFASEIVQKMLTIAHVDAKIKFEDWSKAYRIALRRPNTLIFSTAKTMERESLFIWIGPIWVEQAGIFARSSRKKIDLPGIDGIKNYRYCLIKDSYFHDFLLKHGIEPGKENFAVSLEEMVNRLMLGQTDLIIADRNGVNFTVRSQGYYLSDFEEVLNIPELASPFYISVNRHSKKDLVLSLKNAYAQLDSSGFNAEVIEKYLKEW